MKKGVFACAVVLLLLASTAFAQDYNSALKTAKRENKPVLLYFYSDSCSYCTVMDKKTLADKEITSIIKKDFVFLRLDAVNLGNLSKIYRIMGTPTSWFLDSSGQGVGMMPGYIPPKQYKLILAYIKDKRYNDTDLESYLRQASAKK